MLYTFFTSPCVQHVSPFHASLIVGTTFRKYTY
jgi:hypothetical protein